MASMLMDIPAFGDTGVAVSYGKNSDGSSSLGLLDGITQLGNALNASAPFVAAVKGNAVTTNANGQAVQGVAAATTQQGQSGYATLQNGQMVGGMSPMTMILIGVGALVAIGAVVMLAKKA